MVATWSRLGEFNGRRGVLVLLSGLALGACIARDVLPERFACGAGGLCSPDAGGRRDAASFDATSTDSGVPDPCLEPESEGLLCDDQDACTEWDVCTEGVCVGRARACEPSGPCDDARCDSSTGACIQTPKGDGTECDDGDVCTQGEVCSSGLCVPSGVAEDGIVCSASALPASAVCRGGRCAPLMTCLDLTLLPGPPPTGVYAIAPSLGAEPFAALCDMETESGGWTLVGRELTGVPVENGQSSCSGPQADNGTFRFLGHDSGNPGAIASGASSGLVGRRLQFAYREVMIRWGSEQLAFTLESGEMFQDQVNLQIPIADFRTTDGRLAAWIAADGGASLCIAASETAGVLPGDSSWAIKPRLDPYFDCGCNSGGWAGRGVFYGGTRTPENTACCGFGGGFAGTCDDGEQKGAVSPTHETQIWVR